MHTLSQKSDKLEEGIPQPAFCEAPIVHTARLECQTRLAPPANYSALFKKDYSRGACKNSKLKIRSVTRNLEV